jgi:phosphatidylinositol alpha-1,6-mannosyltransferase
VVAAGSYPAREAVRAARRPLPGVIIPPGVDADRFHPISAAERVAVRRRFGIDPDRPLVLGTSRLVPRKGFDVLIDAMARVRPDAQLVIGGSGRDRARLERRAERVGPGRVRFLGRVPDDALGPLSASADVFAMPCRDRWGGLEVEGFGIVFLEAAACGVPAVAGRSGGSHEAVIDGETGLVVEPNAVAVRDALERLLADPAERAAMGEAARARAVREFSHDRLAARLAPLAAGDLSSLRMLS